MVKCEICGNKVGFWKNIKMCMQHATITRSFNGYIAIKCEECRLNGR